MSTVFHYVTSGNKVFITDVSLHKTWDCKKSNIQRYKFDGKQGKPTFNSIWVEIDKLPEQVAIIVDKRENEYQLIEEFRGFDMPTSLSVEEAKQYRESVIESMYIYVPKREWQEDLVIDDAEFVHMGEFNITNPVKFEYELSNTNQGKSNVIGREAIRYDELGMMFMPSIARSNVPCRIEGKDLYRIIRNHVRANIDGRVARITSDYDFCFRVERVIQLKEPLLTQFVSANGKKSTIIKTERLIPIFEMSPERRDTYTKVEDVVADNEAALKEKIDDILDNIMKGINRHQTECPCCKGSGVTDAKIDVNA